MHNTFAYHLTPGGWILDAGARALGCAVIAAGPGNTEQQLEVIAVPQAERPTSACPTISRSCSTRPRRPARTLPRFKKALVGGGALFPSLRAEYKARGIDTYQTYATADLGIIAYESAALEGMIVDEGVIVEIVRPGTGDPVAGGRGRRGGGHHLQPRLSDDPLCDRRPLGRPAGRKPCGRTNMRIKGWLGRADQTTKVKGMFVHPEQIAEVAKRHAGLGRVRLVVARAGEQDIMTLRAECGNADARAQGASWPRRCRRSPSSRARWSWSPRARCPTTARSLPTSAPITN